MSLPYQLEITQGRGFLHVAFRGMLTHEIGEQIIREAAEKASSWGFQKFFHDYRQARLQITSVQAHDFAYWKAAVLGFERGTRHVLLVDPLDNVAMWQFVAALFREAGYSIHVFTDEQLATSALTAW